MKAIRKPLEIHMKSIGSILGFPYENYMKIVGKPMKTIGKPMKPRDAPKNNSNFEHPTTHPQTVKATTLSETRRPKGASFDAASHATHPKTKSKF